MKNLDSFSCIEMESGKLKEVEGGALKDTLKEAGKVAIGAATAVVRWVLSHPY